MVQSMSDSMSGGVKTSIRAWCWIKSCYPHLVLRLFVVIHRQPFFLDSIWFSYPTLCFLSVIYYLRFSLFLSAKYVKKYVRKYVGKPQ